MTGWKVFLINGNGGELQISHVAHPHLFDPDMICYETIALGGLSPYDQNYEWTMNWIATIEEGNYRIEIEQDDL